MQYKILKEENIIYEDASDNLEEQVNEALKEGWKPQGGVSTVRQKSNVFIISQAMIKD
ncbi:MAG: DUF1737 domain-containing protein [Candidatus Scatovivens sp.]